MNSILPDFSGSFFLGCPAGRPYENEYILKIIWYLYSDNPKGLRLVDNFNSHAIGALHE